MKILVEILCVIMVVMRWQTAQGSRTLMISMDGFRWDYISKTSTPNFDRLIAEGSHVRQVTNAYATLTMPNHWTLATGLFEEEHGIIANKFPDKKLNDSYSFSTDSKWYNNTVPIWITAVKEGKKSGAYMWVGNQATYDGITATKVTPFRSKPDFSLAIDVVTAWFTEDKLDFACLYTDQPDKFGHDYGPDSDEVKSKLRELDRLIGDLMKKFDENDLTASVNILIVSDHGMTDVGSDNSINLATHVNFNEDVEWSYTSSLALIAPNPGKLNKVYDDLKNAERAEGHMTVYKKADMPEELRYKNNSRIPDIIVIAEPGWQLKKGDYEIKMKGNHGFDNKNPDMKTVFIARGPDFKCGHKQDNMRSVDVYPLLCKLLDLQTCHASHGSLDRTSNLLSSESCLIISSAANYEPLLGVMVLNLLGLLVVTGY